MNDENDESDKLQVMKPLSVNISDSKHFCQRYDRLADWKFTHLCVWT